jgi:para-aminobenzoate synthetase component I
MRKFIRAEVEDISLFKERILLWAHQFNVFSALDGKGWNEEQNELILAVEAIDEASLSGNSFEELKAFHTKKNDWLFGFLTYDLKNQSENLSSENFDGLEFPEMHFFQPKYLFRINLLTPVGLSVSLMRESVPIQSGTVEIGFIPGITSEKEIENLLQEINSYPLATQGILPAVEINPGISKAEYIETVNKIIGHIRRGDIYEMNYCMEFFAQEARINPLSVFQKLNAASQTPFSCYYKIRDNYLLCASPERFLKKSGDKIISQPIKGTARRGASDWEDDRLKELLSLNEKEKSENIMIVDLVRNDLSKTCHNVQVEELCAVSSFKQWHQLVSTISGNTRKGMHFTDVLKNAFPMGSMTGAPKIRAMQLIEYYERTKRGLYSGAAGYVTPKAQGEKGDGIDFDFNVVIRSILYNQASGYLSFQAGSAITINSIAENEYDECLLKAKGMFESLKAGLMPFPQNGYPAKKRNKMPKPSLVK